MKRIIISLLVSSVLTISFGAHAHEPQGSCDRWAESAFGRGVTPPFSFKYDGVESSKLLSKWRFSRTELEAERADESLVSYCWAERRGSLRVECQVKTFADFDAVEWVLILHNDGTSNTGQISELLSIDLEGMPGQAGHDVKGNTLGDEKGPYKVVSPDKVGPEYAVFHSCGAQYGPDDFCSSETRLAVGDTLLMYPDGGRSSSHKLPYFNVRTPNGGMIYAIGWTGQWQAVVGRPAEDRMSVQAGIQTFDAYLRPGESVRLPSVLMFPWSGDDWMDGQNILRRMLMSHYHPMQDGEPLKTPLFNNFSNGDPWPCDEYTCATDYYNIMVVKRNAMFGTVVDGYWLDAGWFSRADDWQDGYWWHNAVGNWTPDPERFPDGLSPVADEIHKQGGKFMVWFEPERANVDSDWAHEHPEYMLAESGERAVPLDYQVDSAFIVNLGNPDALDFVCKSMVQALTDARADCYRQDFNIDPLRFWLNNDEPDRVGMTEVLYVNGLYKYLDYLHEQLPHLMIDNCAGGGRRLDIEMMRRSIPMWRDDYSISSLAEQCHTYYLSQWLPVHCTLYGRKRYDIMSSMTAGGVLCWGVNGGPSVHDRKRIIEFMRGAMPYFTEDYYPLCGYGDITSEDIMLAYQLHRPSDGTGYVYSFRRAECEADEITVRLHGVDPTREYLLEEPLMDETLSMWDDKGQSEPVKSYTVDGRTLAEGYSIKIPRRESYVVFRYRAL